MILLAGALPKVYACPVYIFTEEAITTCLTSVTESVIETLNKNSYCWFVLISYLILS